MLPSSDTEIYQEAVQLFDELWNGQPIRLLGIRSSKLVGEDEPQQLSIFDIQIPEKPLQKVQKEKEKDAFAALQSIKQEKLAKALDEIRGKYGENAVTRGSFLKNNREGKEMESMKTEKIKWKEIGTDILVDLAAGMALAIGIYNFALNANFPVAGFSGVAIILYHVFGIPVGAGTILLNVPVAIFCYKYLGRIFFLKSAKSMIISSLLMDYVAPLLPVYEGSRLLAALCMGVLTGIGYALIFMRGSSTGGQDFITVAIRKARPHMTLGIITFVLDMITILLGSLIVFKEVDGFIYGVIVTYLMASVMDRIMYGIDEGKMTLIVTEKGREVAQKIDQYSGRGSTILKGTGSYSSREKDVVMCACNNKEMYTIKRIVGQVDPEAFTIIMESNEVVGEGFKENEQQP